MDQEANVAVSTYVKPKLTHFGSFADLTLIGPAQGSDIGSVFGLSAGCNPFTSDKDFACAVS